MERAFVTPSARLLGRDLVVCHMPPKHCSYACRHCTAGTTRQPEVVRHPFHAPEVVCREVARQYARLHAEQVVVEGLVFAPQGEATLDSRLGEMIEGVRPLGLTVAVVSNASLLWREDVRADLARADQVRLKLDTVDPTLWRALNRPHPGLDLAAILAGIRAFASEFTGELSCVTARLKGVNDAPEVQTELAGFLRDLGLLDLVTA